MKIKLLNSQVIENKQSINEGQLSFFDGTRVYLSQINRVYSVFSVRSGITRGHHAHRKLEQLMFCAYGKIKLSLTDGNEIIDVILDHPSKILYVGPMIWHTMEWLVDDSVLVVLASDNYDESDYIRDYNEFIRMVSDEKSSL